jgi:peptidoglycan hydrolase CwlO-like protein
MAITIGCSDAKKNNAAPANTAQLEQTLEYLGELTNIYVSMYEALQKDQAKPAEIISDLKKLEAQLAAALSALPKEQPTEAEAALLYQWATAKGEAVALAHSELEKLANYTGEITLQLYDAFWTAMEKCFEYQFLYLEHLKSKQ